MLWHVRMRHWTEPYPRVRWLSVTPSPRKRQGIRFPKECKEEKSISVHNPSYIFVIAKRLAISKFSIRQVSHLAIYSQFLALLATFYRWNLRLSKLQSQASKVIRGRLRSVQYRPRLSLNKNQNFPVPT